MLALPKNRMEGLERSNSHETAMMSIMITIMITIRVMIILMIILMMVMIQGRAV